MFNADDADDMRGASSWAGVASNMHIGSSISMFVQAFTCVLSVDYGRVCRRIFGNEASIAGNRASVGTG